MYFFPLPRNPRSGWFVGRPPHPSLGRIPRPVLVSSFKICLFSTGFWAIRCFAWRGPRRWFECSRWLSAWLCRNLTAVDIRLWRTICRWSVVMARLYIGNLDPRVTARELEDEFRTFGVLRRSVVLSPQILRFVCLVLEIHACLLVWSRSDDNHKDRILLDIAILSWSVVGLWFGVRLVSVCPGLQGRLTISLAWQSRVVLQIVSCFTIKYTGTVYNCPTILGRCRLNNTHHSQT
jgi:hypothetical protein